MIRRHAALDTKCWEKNLRSSGDWVAWTLVATAGPFVYVPNFTALEYRELSSGISQTVSTSYDNFIPALDTVYTDARITKRFSEEHLADLRAQRISHIWFFIASLHVRKGLFIQSLSYMKECIKAAPKNACSSIIRYGIAVADTLI